MASLGMETEGTVLFRKNGSLFQQKRPFNKPTPPFNKQTFYPININCNFSQTNSKNHETCNLHASVFALLKLLSSDRTGKNHPVKPERGAGICL